MGQFTSLRIACPTPQNERRAEIQMERCDASAGGKMFRAANVITTLIAGLNSVLWRSSVAVHRAARKLFKAAQGGRKHRSAPAVATRSEPVTLPMVSLPLSPEAVALDAIRRELAAFEFSSLELIRARRQRRRSLRQSNGSR